MTIDGLNFKSDSFPELNAEVRATVYLSPKEQGTTAGGTPRAPAPQTTQPGTSPAAPDPVAQEPRRRRDEGQALGVVQDLRDRRLLPVAILLVAALIASRCSCSSPASRSRRRRRACLRSRGRGLPTPEEALQAGDKPLVSLAVLDKPSNLASFESKDPFKPLNQVSTAGATTGAPTSSRRQQLRRQQLRRQLTVDKGASGGGGVVALARQYSSPGGSPRLTAA